MFKPLLATLLLLTAFGCGPDNPPVRVDNPPEAVDAGQPESEVVVPDAGEPEDDDGVDAGESCKCRERHDGGKPKHKHCRGRHGPH